MVAVVVLLAAAGCGSSGGAPQASCAGPQVSVSPATAAPGDEVRVRGRFFLTDCYDTGQTGTPPPSQDLAVAFRAGERTVPLATLDAAPDGTIDTTVRVPDDAPPGAAQIAVGSATAELVVEPPA